MQTHPVRTGRLPLSTGQLIRLAALGAALWLTAALLLRWLGPLGVYDGAARILLYALIIPGTAPFIWLIAKIGGLARSDLALGVSVVVAAAVLLDGLALAWVPTLYGAELALQAGAGAAILWGAGVALVLGFVFNRAR
ncbi:hypothetical protein L2D01_04205 [Hyphomonadaceae bacterium ML37]|nr:hypothetical protein L2D01_04205 [Hyphomonadaceae bacterium ML37]